MKIEKCGAWPRWLANDLGLRKNKKITPQWLRLLSQAMSCLWRALNIYDDFLDGSGQISKLGLANSEIRQFYKIIYALHLPADFYQLADSLWAKVDRANGREIKEIDLQLKRGLIIIPKKLPHLPSLKSLSQKSLILTIGPMALLARLNYQMKSPRAKAILNFFSYALAAKQLADDSEDWLEDLKNGQITRANFPILEFARQHKLKLKITGDLTKLNLLFFETASLKIINNLEKLCLLARQELAKAALLKTSYLISEFIKPLEKACSDARGFRALMAK